MLLTLRVKKVTGGLRVTAMGLGDRHPDGLVLPVAHGERLVRRLLKDYGTVSADRHPLTRFHDRLLGGYLIRELVLQSAVSAFP